MDCAAGTALLLPRIHSDGELPYMSLRPISAPDSSEADMYVAVIHRPLPLLPLRLASALITYDALEVLYHAAEHRLHLVDLDDDQIAGAHD